MRAVNPAPREENPDGYTDFANEYGVKMTCIPSASRPGWPAGSSHWKCTLTKGRKRMTVDYSMGSAHKGDPDIGDVLEALASDSRTADFNSTREFMREFGYEFGYENEKEAAKIFRDVRKNRNKLVHLLGEWDANKLIYEVREENPTILPHRQGNPPWLDTDEYPKGWTALGAFIGSALGLIPGAALGSGLLAGIGSITGGAAGGHYMAPDDRKNRGAFGGGMGGFIFGPLGAAIGGAIGGRKPDKRNRNPASTLKNKLLR